MTRPRTQRGSWLAFWLALAALGLNAVLPIHLALDLGEACAAPDRSAAASVPHNLEWRLLALATGHDPGDGSPDTDGHRPACPAFGALGAFAGFAEIAAPALPIPAAIAVPPLFAAIAAEPDRTPAPAYRSRAPPIG